MSTLLNSLKSAFEERKTHQQIKEENRKATLAECLVMTSLAEKPLVEFCKDIGFGESQDVVSDAREWNDFVDFYASHRTNVNPEAVTLLVDLGFRSDLSREEIFKKLCDRELMLPDLLDESKTLNHDPLSDTSFYWNCDQEKQPWVATGLPFYIDSARNSPCEQVRDESLHRIRQCDPWSFPFVDAIMDIAEAWPLSLQSVCGTLSAIALQRSCYPASKDSKDDRRKEKEIIADFIYAKVIPEITNGSDQDFGESIEFLLRSKRLYEEHIIFILKNRKREEKLVVLAYLWSHPMVENGTATMSILSHILHNEECYLLKSEAARALSECGLLGDDDLEKIMDIMKEAVVEERHEIFAEFTRIFVANNNCVTKYVVRTIVKEIHKLSARGLLSKSEWNYNINEWLFVFKSNFSKYKNEIGDLLSHLDGALLI